VFELTDILAKFEDLLFRKIGFYSIKLKKSSNIFKFIIIETIYPPDVWRKKGTANLGN